MENNETLILLYILFIWSVVIHTFEEISQGIFEIELGHIKMTRKKYLIAASIITTINLGTLSLLVYGSKIGLYLAILTSSTLGILQALVHSIGYFKEGRKSRNLGAGFYSSIPLALVGGILLHTILARI
ncbi:MAG: hypothetical protein ABFS09_12620 [Thermodesulfobacteriota bacterium]